MPTCARSDRSRFPLPLAAPMLDRDRSDRSKRSLPPKRVRGELNRTIRMGFEPSETQIRVRLDANETWMRVWRARAWTGIDAVPGGVGSSGEKAPELPFRIAGYRGGRGAIRIASFIPQSARRARLPADLLALNLCT